MKNYTKEIIIAIYKFFVYALLLLIFIFFMSKVNVALLYISRTSIITVASYFLGVILLMPVYGNFEIGVRKTKLVFNATMISIFFSNIIAFVMLMIMGINQYPVSLLLTRGLMYLFFAFVVQLFVAWFAAGWGNNLYFTMFKPSKTIIIENDKETYKKIEKYILTHKKQYRLLNTYHNPLFTDLKLEGVSTIVSIGMDSQFDKRMIRYCYSNEIAFLYDTEIHDLFSGKNKTVVIDDVLMIDFPAKKLTFGQLITKRFIDIFFSLILLVLASPIFLLIAIAIKMDDGGPIFYQQERLTKNGAIFNIIKFRSMKINSGNQPATLDDDRITRVGHLVRKIRMDELPQFINILKGEMSIVGPRPESIEIMNIITKEVPDFAFRLKVKGGLTGYAQIFGKYNTSPKKKLLLDLKYIESFSIVNDIKLIMQTIIVFFKSDSTEAFDPDQD